MQNKIQRNRKILTVAILDFSYQTIRQLSVSKKYNEKFIWLIWMSLFLNTDAYTCLIDKTDCLPTRCGSF